MSIAIGPEQSKEAAERGSDLARAVSKDEKGRRRDVVPSTRSRRRASAPNRVTDQVERADQLWVEISAGHVGIAAVNNEIDTLFAPLQKLDRDGRFEEELRVAQSLSRLLAVAMRWIAPSRSANATDNAWRRGPRSRLSPSSRGTKSWCSAA